MDALTRDLCRLGVEHTALVPFRVAVLERLRLEVPFDAAIFHALSPRVPLSSAAVIGVPLEALAGSQRHWDELAVELGALRELANQRGVATDRDAYPMIAGSGSKGRARFAEHMRPFKMRRMAIVHLTVRGAVRSAIALLSKDDDAFSAPQMARLAELAPIVALADALLVMETSAPRAEAPVRLRCEDQRLTPRHRTIVEHVALGHTNEQIAEALSLSPNTLRNHLAEIFRRLSASNRADVVRLAVLTPMR